LDEESPGTGDKVEKAVDPKEEKRKKEEKIK
jgi:hypothetical protein